MFQCQGISQQEIVEAELASVLKQRAALQEDLDAASEQGAKISALHAKRDQILGKYQHFEPTYFLSNFFHYRFLGPQFHTGQIYRWNFWRSICIRYGTKDGKGAWLVAGTKAPCRFCLFQVETGAKNV